MLIVFSFPFYHPFLNPSSRYFSINSCNWICAGTLSRAALHYARLNASQKSYSGVRKTQDWMECGLAGRTRELSCKVQNMAHRKGYWHQRKNCSPPGDKRFRLRWRQLPSNRMNHGSLIKLDSNWTKLWAALSALHSGINGLHLTRFFLEQT